MYNFDSTEKQFTAADMVSFGKYLVSETRENRIIANTQSGEDVLTRIQQVYDADLRNWENAKTFKL